MRIILCHLMDWSPVDTTTLTPQQIAGRLTAALATITSLWDDMLEPTGPAEGSGQGEPRVIQICNVRQEINWQVRGWCTVLIEDHALTDNTPNGHDTLALCDYLRRHINLLAEHAAATDALQELEDCAEAVEHCVYGAPARRQPLGACPNPTCNGTVRDTATFDPDGRRLATCTHCHTERTQYDWANAMGITIPTSLTKKELIALAHADYGLTLTEHGITCLVNRGTLRPLSNNRPQQFGYVACIDYLTSRRART